MKNIVLSLSLLFFVQANVNAQQIKSGITSINKPTNQCDDLKKENDSLKKALGLNESISSLSRNDIEYRIVKSIGDKKTQTITIELMLTNLIENRNFELQGIMDSDIKIVTLGGDVVFCDEKIIPGSSSSLTKTTTLHTNTPLKITLKFSPILPSNEYLKLFFFSYDLRNLQDFRKDIKVELEFKDLKISWK